MEWLDTIVNGLVYLSLMVGGAARVLVLAMLILMFADVGVSNLALKGLIIAVGWGSFFYRLYRDRD